MVIPPYMRVKVTDIYETWDGKWAVETKDRWDYGTTFIMPEKPDCEVGDVYKVTVRRPPYIGDYGQDVWGCD